MKWPWSTEKVIIRESLAGNERKEDIGYRRLSDRSAQELNPLDSNVLLRIVRWLYYTNPAARRMVEIPVDYGYNVKITAKSSSTQEIIDRFWNHPANDMPEFIGQLMERFHLDGELLLPVEVNTTDGSVVLKYEDPIQISKIEAYAENKRIIDTVKINVAGGSNEKVFKIIRYISDISNLREYGYRVGNAFYFRQCHLITGRGRPPLEPAIDWLDVHDHTLFDQLRNVALQSAHVWDVTLTGANQQQCDDRAAKIRQAGPPKPGTINVHNDKEIWEPKSPKIEPRIATDLLVQVRKYFGLGLAKSETWVAAADDVNRATAMVADTPPQRHLERQQIQEKSIIRAIIDFVLDQAELAGYQTIDDRDYTIHMPDIATSDSKSTAEALRSLTEACALALQNSMVDIETVRNLFFKISGMEIPEDLEKRIKDYDAEKAADGYVPPSAYINRQPGPKSSVGADGLPETS